MVRRNSRRTAGQKAHPTTTDAKAAKKTIDDAINVLLRLKGKWARGFLGKDWQGIEIHNELDEAIAELTLF